MSLVTFIASGPKNYINSIKHYSTFKINAIFSQGSYLFFIDIKNEKKFVITRVYIFNADPFNKVYEISRSSLFNINNFIFSFKPNGWLSINNQISSISAPCQILDFMFRRSIRRMKNFTGEIIPITNDGDEMNKYLNRTITSLDRDKKLKSLLDI